VDDAGDLVLLEDQDRSRWDSAAIVEATEVLDRAIAMSRPGPFQLQAAIAACHATAPTAAATDWVQIATLYGRLGELVPSPVIALNRAVAHGYAFGPERGLARLAEARAGGGLDAYPLVLAVEADLTARLGDRDRAVALFEQAAAAAPSAVERRALLDRANEVADGAPPGAQHGA